MTSNVDYTICPKCLSLNAAIWKQNGFQTYEVYCSDCGHEYERGRFASDGVRLLVHKIKPPDEDGLLPLTPEEIKEILIDAHLVGRESAFWEEI